MLFINSNTGNAGFAFEMENGLVMNGQLKKTRLNKIYKQLIIDGMRKRVIANMLLFSKNELFKRQPTELTA